MTFTQVQSLLHEVVMFVTALAALVAAWQGLRAKEHGKENGKKLDRIIKEKT